MSSDVGRHSWFHGPVDELEQMRRAAAIQGAIARAPGGQVTVLDPRPLVKVRVVYGRAVAITPTHVLHEWVRYGEYHCRWDERRQVIPMSPDEWAGEPFEDAEGAGKGPENPKSVK